MDLYHHNDETTLYTCVVIAIIGFAIYFVMEPFFYRSMPAYDNVINVRILPDGSTLLRQPGAS